MAKYILDYFFKTDIGRRHDDDALYPFTKEFDAKDDDEAFSKVEEFGEKKCHVPKRLIKIIKDW
jgi:hypothetical protein